MDANLDPSLSPTETPQLLSSKFLRKTKFRKEEPSNERIKAFTGEMAINAGDMKLKDKQESTTSVAAAARDTPVTNSAHASSPLSKGVEVPQILDENTVESNKTDLSLLDGAISLTSETGTSHATDLSSSSVTPLTFPPTQAVSAPTTSSVPLFTLSPEELDHAKTLVLDLLGWGVDPEYLVESGISSAVIFRVFTDLNLRLPKNLVISERLIDVAYSWGPRPSEFTQAT